MGLLNACASRAIGIVFVAVGVLISRAGYAGDDKEGYHLPYVSCCTPLHQIEEGIEEAKARVALHPNDASAWFELARNYRSAYRKLYDNVKAQGDDESETRSMIQVVFRANGPGFYSETVKNILKAAELNPTESGIQIGLCTVLRELSEHCVHICSSEVATLLLENKATDAELEQYKECVKRLGSNDFKTREEAIAELTLAGLKATSELHAALEMKDEVKVCIGARAALVRAWQTEAAKRYREGLRLTPGADEKMQASDERLPLPAEDVLRIPVVGTWKELAAAPEITLKDGQKVRVGIEATEAPAGSQVMLYVLSDKNGCQWKSGDYAIGPLKFYIDSRKSTDWGMKRPFVTNKLTLWCAAIPVESFDKIGSVRLFDQNSEVGSAIILRRNDKYHHWTVLRINQTGKKAVGEPAPIRELTATGLRVTPQVCSYVPVKVAGASLLNTEESLPSLLVYNRKNILPDYDLKAITALIGELGSESYDTRAAATRALCRMGPGCIGILRDLRSTATDAEIVRRLGDLIRDFGGEFHISWREGMIRMRCSYAADHPELLNGSHLFARWWLNGTPVQIPLSSEDRLELLPLDHEPNAEAVYFGVESSLKVIGAKKGDQISIQFLFTPFDGNSRAMPEGEEGVGDDFPSVSNKIEFTAP
jgi:hypothetical protein